MFLTVTKRMCGDSAVHLECPLDQLLDVYDIWMGTAEDKMCAPKDDNKPECKITDASSIVDVGKLCQNKTQCEFSFPSGHVVTILDLFKNIKCSIYVLSLTYSCTSKYWIEINKSLRLRANLAVSANTDKAVYGTMPNINTKTLNFVANIFGLA